MLNLHQRISKTSTKNRLSDNNTQNQKTNDINLQKTSFYIKDYGLEGLVKVCYTVISGPYDRLKEPRVVTPGWKYICFTDQKFTSDVWEIRPLPKEIVEDSTLTQVKRQRIMKIQPYLFFEYDISVWVDGNLTIIGNLDEFVKENYADLSITAHPARNCIYDEARAIVRCRKDTQKNIDTQVDLYKKEKFPQHYGLNETNVIIRRNTEDVRKVMDMWAEVLRKYSHRDQMSFNYVLWKLGMKNLLLSFDVKVRNKYFKLSGHRR